MPKQILASGNFYSIVYMRTCDIITTPICTCLCISGRAALYDRPIRGSSARQRPSYCKLEFGFGFGPICYYHSDPHGCRLSCGTSLSLLTEKKYSKRPKKTGEIPQSWVSVEIDAASMNLESSRFLLSHPTDFIFKQLPSDIFIVFCSPYLCHWNGLLNRV